MKTQAKHTPGPWGIQSTLTATKVYGNLRAGPINPKIGAPIQVFGMVAMVDDEADARLIAAAPELLAAAKNTINHCGSCKMKSCFNPNHQALQAAIAKAEGVK